jgi:hypothetical protein
VTGLATGLDAHERLDAARAQAQALPPLTDAQVAHIAALLTLGLTPKAAL